MDTALRLFNDIGTEKISTRHIAQELEISVGNLHYHYPTKDAVLVALHTRFIESTNEIAEQIDPEASNPRPVIEATFRLIWRYRFLFNERLVVERRVPAIAESFKEMIRARRRMFRLQIEQMQARGLVTTDFDDEQFEALFEHIVIVYNAWTSHVAMLSPRLTRDDSVIERYVELAARLWTPYLRPQS